METKHDVKNTVTELKIKVDVETNTFHESPMYKVKMDISTLSGSGICIIKKFFSDMGIQAFCWLNDDGHIYIEVYSSDIAKHFDSGLEDICHLYRNLQILFTRLDQYFFYRIGAI